MVPRWQPARGYENGSLYLHFSIPAKINKHIVIVIHFCTITSNRILRCIQNGHKCLLSSCAFHHGIALLFNIFVVLLFKIIGMNRPICLGVIQSSTTWNCGFVVISSLFNCLVTNQGTFAAFI